MRPDEHYRIDLGTSGVKAVLVQGVGLAGQMHAVVVRRGRSAAAAGGGLHYRQTLFRRLYPDLREASTVRLNRSSGPPR